MTVYIFMLLFIYILGFFFTNMQEDKVIQWGIGKEILFFIITCIFICISGLRYNVGADFFGYYNNFDYYAADTLNIFENNEIGIRIIAKIAMLIGSSPQIYIFLCSMFTIVLFMLTIKKYSEITVMSLMLYVFLGMFLGSFNAIRQYLAVSIVFFSIRYIFETKWKPWVISICVAFLFHTSAIFILPIYWLVTIKNKKLFVLFLSIVAVIAFFSYDQIFLMIDNLKGNINGNTSERLYAQNEVSLFRVAASWAPVLLCYFPAAIRPENNKDRILINYTLLAAILQTVSMNSTYLARFCTYTTAVNILTIPALIKYQDDNNRFVLKFLIYVLYFIYWTAEATGPYVVNYQWCF